MKDIGILVALLLVAVLSACGGGDDTGPGAPAAGGGAGTGAGGTAAVGAGGAAAIGGGGMGAIGPGGASGGGGIGPTCGPPDTWSACATGSPGGGQVPPPLPGYSGGACPQLVPWDATTKPYNAVAGGRQFILVVPQNQCPGERFPVVFLWHWISGEAKDFLGGNSLQMASDQYRIIFAIPEAKGAMVGSLDTQWPFDLLQPEPRMQEEYRFFDDMYSCIGQQLNINNNCVGSLGISAGALFNSQLLQARGQYLSAVVVMSGGTGSVVRPFVGSPHKMPALVLWGGPNDNFGGVFNFDVISRDLVNGLASTGHFVIECVHNCGHFPPLITQDMNGNNFDGLSPLFEFFLQHPYWLPDGASPYAAGLPSNFPAFCGIGPGSGNLALSPPCPGGTF